MTEGPLSQQPLSEGAYQAVRCCWACLPSPHPARSLTPSLSDQLAPCRTPCALMLPPPHAVAPAAGVFCMLPSSQAVLPPGKPPSMCQQNLPVAAAGVPGWRGGAGVCAERAEPERPGAAAGAAGDPAQSGPAQRALHAAAADAGPARPLQARSATTTMLKACLAGSILSCSPLR